MALDKPITDINEHDLQTLFAEKEAESRSLDYKVMLNLDVERAKEDFRKDVSAFANSAGGDLVIGIRDENGIPTEVCGFDLGNQSQEQYRLRLLELLQSRIKPRVQGVGIRPFQLENGLWAAVVRVPRSFAKPHQIEIGNKDFQFWFRHDSGNQRMDVDELRDAILASDTLAERRRTFRIERVGSVLAGETPIPVGDAPKTVLHVIPLGAFSLGSSYDLSVLTQGNLSRLSPIIGPPGYFRHNFDGYLTSFTQPVSSGSNSYLQIFRNGIVEAVDTRIMENSRQAGSFPASYVEAKLIAALRRIFALQQELGVMPPVLVMLTLVGVAGLNIVRNNFPFSSQSSPIDRDVLMIPEALVEIYPDTAEGVFRPIFDTVWNAAGYSACPNYDDNGVWASKDYH